jgi:CRP/FNR family transcriptional regulator, cyclic AMP receptor protein
VLSSSNWPESSFAGQLSDRARQALLELGASITYRPRQTMVRQGEDSRYTLLMLSGYAKVSVNADGQDILLAIRGPGDLVGEMATLGGSTRSANVVAAGPVTARVIKGAELADTIERHSDMCFAVARALGERLRAADRRAVDFVSCPGRIRVYRVIADLIASCGVRTAGGWRPGFPMSQSEIASLAGVGLSTVEKALVVMQEHGVLERRYRQIVVSDQAELRRLGGLGQQNPY